MNPTGNVARVIELSAMPPAEVIIKNQLYRFSTACETYFGCNMLA